MCLTLVFLFTTVYADLGESDTYVPAAAIREVEVKVEEGEMVANVRVADDWYHVGNAHAFLFRYNKAIEECK